MLLSATYFHQASNDLCKNLPAQPVEKDLRVEGVTASLSLYLNIFESQ